MKRRGHRSAYTLSEMLVVASLVGLVGAMVMPSAGRIINTTHGQRCCANILQIESAKDQFIADHPGQALSSEDDLLPYLKFGLPTCPSGGVYSNTTDRYSRVTCSEDDGEIDGLHDYGHP